MNGRALTKGSIKNTNPINFSTSVGKPLHETNSNTMLRVNIETGDIEHDERKEKYWHNTPFWEEK